MAAVSIVILTGAGISAESGIRTFRDANGLWENHRVEEVASPEGYARNPALVQRFYNERRRQLLSPEIQPNAAHIALARLEQHYRGQVLLITQNIDDLHERAGSQQLLHMHGELLKMHCVRCQARTVIQRDISLQEQCESCGNVGTMRPDIVWFGEMPYHMEAIERALSACGLFISIGTSGHVYPAAGFVQRACIAGARTIEVNLEPSLGRNLFAETRYGVATREVPRLVDDLLAG